ncbi:hypothetical protein SAMN05443287_10859 [Micromonospora phaseoli]|uniref:Uncharacterized protein n=1 Tax=Micromonospora phaseoli TaxID=1144548 RepID=A0A1H7BVJ1_9ACTN|nr:hypothetical protein CLV64_110225 [Micromonospora phaseoli]GIJ76542.1 hypothetical protein Xph01_09740 [Micromonospora phaseoli]SEJ81579.1 hypothetical protein SAMN05443287_10859 [Micromonospora phaseoli]
MLILATVIDVLASRRLASWIRIAARKRPGDIPVIRRNSREKWYLLNIATLASSSIVSGSPSLSRIVHNARLTATSPINIESPGGPVERSSGAHMMRRRSAM